MNKTCYLLLALLACLYATNNACADLGDALEAPGLTWTTSPDYPWLEQSENTWRSDSALEAPVLAEVAPYGTNSWLMVETGTSGTLVFYYRITAVEDSSEFVSLKKTGSTSRLDDFDGNWHKAAIWTEDGTITFQQTNIPTASEHPVFFLDQVRFYPSPSRKIRFFHGDLSVSEIEYSNASGPWMEINATPDAGLDFLHWNDEEETRTSSIQVPSSYEYYLTGYISKSIEFDGISLSTGGVETWEAIDKKLMPSIMFGGPSWIEFTCDGPGVLTFTTDRALENLANNGLYIYQNGVEVDIPLPTSPDSNQYAIRFPDTGGNARLELRLRNDSGDRGLEILDMDWTSGFTVTTNTLGPGTVQVTPKKDSYQKGELIILEVTPNVGYKFNGWFNQEALPVPANKSFKIGSHIDLQAVFLPEELVDFQLAGDAPWTAIADPDAAGSYLLTVDELPVFGEAYIFTDATSVGTLSYDYRYALEEDVFGINLYNDYLDNSTGLGHENSDWHFASTNLASPVYAGVHLETNKLLENNRVYIKNLQFEPGYQLEITHENGTVQRTPNQDHFAPDSWVHLEAIPDDGYQFYSWKYVPNTVTQSQSSVDFQMVTHYAVEAIFSKVLEENPFDISFWGQDDWTKIADSDSSTGYTWNFKPELISYNQQDGLLLFVDGPGILSFEANGNGDYTGCDNATLFLDDDEQLTIETDLNVPWQGYSLPVGPGTHKVSVGIEGSCGVSPWDFKIRSLELQPGAQIQVDVIGSGMVSFEPDTAVIPYGDPVSLTGIPGDNPFQRWLTEDGESLTDNPLVFTAEDHTSLTAYFGDSFTLIDHLWWMDTYNSWEKEASSETLSLPLEPSDSAHIESIIEGPGQFNIHLSSDATLEDFSISIFINGDHEMTLNGNPDEMGTIPVTLLEDSNEVLITFNNDSSDPSTNLSISFEPFQNGFLLDWADVPGGSISASHSPGIVPVGTEVTLTATPDTNNAFDEWAGWDGSQTKTIDFPMMEPMSLQARYTVENWGDIPAETVASYGNWHIEHVDGQTKLVTGNVGEALDRYGIVLSIAGPGVLAGDTIDGLTITNFTIDYLYASSSIDTQVLQEPQDQWSLVVDEGEQEIVLRFENSDSSNSSFEAVLNNLRFYPGYTISYSEEAVSGFGSLEFSPAEAITYPIDSTVSVTAQTSPDFQFSDWGNNYGDSNPLVLTMDQHHFLAPFAGFAATNGLMRLTSLDVRNGNYEVLTGAAPSGQDAIRFYPQESSYRPHLRIPVKDENGYLHFYWKLLDPESLSRIDIKDSRDSGSYIFQLRNYTDAWHEELIPIRGLNASGDAWAYIEFGGYLAEGADFILGDVSYESGQIISAEAFGGTVSISPDKLTYKSGDIVTINATPEDDSYAFAGWFGDLRSDDESFTTNISSTLNLTGFYTQPLDYQGLSFKTNAAHPWFEDNGIYGDESYLREPETNDIASLLALDVTGPTCLSYTSFAYDYDPYVEIFLDHEPIAYIESTSTETHESISIPEGDHTLYWLVRSAENELSTAGFRFYDFQLTEGYQIKVTTPAGSVLQQPLKNAYDLGDSVAISLSLPKDCVFDYWEGDLEGQDSSLQFTVDGHLEAQAHLHIEGRLGDLVWQIPVDAGWVYFDSSAIIRADSELATESPITATVEGPCTIRILSDRAYEDYNYGYLQFFIDGTHIAPLNSDPQQSDTYIFIPDGTHTLEAAYLIPEQHSHRDCNITSCTILPFNPNLNWYIWLGEFDEQTAVALKNNPSKDLDSDNVSDILEFIFERDPQTCESTPLANILQIGTSIPIIRLNYAPNNLSDYYTLVLQQSTNMKDWTTLYDFADMDLEAFDDHLDIDLPDYDPTKPCFLRIHLEE